MRSGEILTKTIFQQINEIPEDTILHELQSDSLRESKRRAISQLKQKLRGLLYNKQRIYLKENLINLHNRRFLDGFVEDISPTVQQCFYFFSQALANARSLRVLDISGMDLHPLLVIELGIGLQHNSSLQELHMGSCRMNNFCLQYIFSSLSNHKTLQFLNLFNNQGFTIDLMNDLNQFLFQGKNSIRKLKLTHCNISTTALSYLFRNIKSSKSIRSLDVSMMYFNSEVLTSLGIAIEEYKGKDILESLNISDCNIRDQGLQTLAQMVSWNIRKINIKELILRSNQITQAGVQDLETFLRKIDKLKKLDLSNNKIEELTCFELHQRKMYEVHLANNYISVFPSSFLMNTLVVNLSNNKISSKGAFQLSNILRQNPLWIELNLTSNLILSEGFNSLIFGLRDNRMLKKFIVADNQLDGESIICYMINHEQVQFEHLDISLNQIRFKIIFQFLNYIKSGLLRSFRCSYLQSEEYLKKGDKNKPEETNLYQSFQLASLNLTELDFHGNKNIFSTVVQSLSMYFNKIEKLNLSNCTPITDSDIEQLCQFLRKSGMVRELNLSNLNLGNLKNKTIKMLGDAISMSSLKYLNLSRTLLYKKINKLFHLKSISTNLKIESLDISFNCLEGKHLIFIEKMLSKFLNLKILNLSHNSLSFECLIAINKAVEENGSIRNLNLSSQKLSGDDLLILSQTISSEGLQSLDLSNNLYTTKMKTYFQQCSTKKQRFLKFQHTYFDESNFLSLLKLIQSNKRSLRGICLDSCFFKTGQYIEFCRYLAKCKKLEYFENTYNPTLDQDLRNMDQMITDYQLKSFKMHQIHIPWTFLQGLNEQMQTTQCQLIVIDFSKIIFEQESFNTLCMGIANNNSLKELLLNNCQLGILDLCVLGTMICQNNSLEILELANNQIDSLDRLIIGMKEQQSFTKLKKFNLSGNQPENESLVKLFSPIHANKKQFLVSTMNLSYCQINNQILKSILQAQIMYNSNFSLTDIISLSLSDNQLNEESGFILKDIIINCPNLQEISLASNLLGSQGSCQVLKGVLNNQSVRTVDLSINQISDLMVEMITHEFLNNQFESLQFLLLRGNIFTQKAQKRLIEFLSFQQSLFIDYVWTELNDNDAEQILIQYTKIGQKFRLDQQTMPYFIKEIQIQNSQLTDKFSELLAKYYPLLSFIEFIDISDNPYITMYGKIYLFIHIFDQSFAKHNLKALYFGDTQEIMKLYDDGLLRYLLMKFRNFLYPPANHNMIKSVASQTQLFRRQVQNDKKSIISSFIGGLCGLWLLHKINQLMKYLDKIEPPQFIVSTLFVENFRNNNMKIKIIVLILGIIQFSISFAQFSQYMFTQKSDYETLYMEFQERCNLSNSDSCYNQDLITRDKLFCSQLFVTIFVADLFQLFLGLLLRKRIKPAFQILRPNILKYFQCQFPHVEEIYRMIFSIIWKFCSYPERQILYYLTTFNHTSIKGDSYQLQTLLYIMIGLVIIRFYKSILFTFYNNFIFLRMNPQDDQAKFLKQFQKCMHYQGYFVISETLVSLCPFQGYQISNALVINEEIIMSTFTILFSEIPILLLIVILRHEYSHLMNTDFHGYDPLGMFYFWIVIVFIKQFLAILVMLFRIFTVRPAVVKQHGFNQGLTLKKFAENRNQFIPSSHMKIDFTEFSQAKPKPISKEKKEELSQPSSNLKNSYMGEILEEEEFNEEIQEIQDEENNQENEGQINNEIIQLQ